MTKEIITTESQDTIGFDLDGKTIDEAIEVLLRIKSNFEGQDIVLDYCGERYDDRYDLHIKIRREETDEEYATRLENEKNRREAQEKRERAEYERLQKQFGGK